MNGEQKPLLKTGRLGRSETDRSPGQPAMTLKFTGRVGSGREDPDRFHLWITFPTWSELFERTRFLTFENHWKKLSCLILFLHAI